MNISIDHGWTNEAGGRTVNNEEWRMTIREENKAKNKNEEKEELWMQKDNLMASY